jgi:hypothetical protein
MTAIAKAADGRFHFRRSAGTAAIQLLASTVGGLAFAALALLWLVGVLPADPPELRPFLAVLAGFFALLLFAGTARSARRYTQATILRVGPDGLWMPDVGLLAWGDIADVRLESYNAPGEQGLGLARQSRLGIVPSTDAPVAQRSAPLGWRLAGTYFRVVGSFMPEGQMGLDHLAPLGIDATEFTVPLDEVLDAIGEFQPDCVDGAGRRDRKGDLAHSTGHRC